MGELVMRRIVFQNKAGFTLVEVMIALVVALLVFLALMQTALVSIDSNMRNVLRDEAVSIAEMRMNEMKSSPFTSVVSDTGSLSGYDCPTGFSTGVPVERDLKNISGFDFCTNLICSEIGGDGHCATSNYNSSKQITITVGWKWKGENYTHRITTIRRDNG